MDKIDENLNKSCAELSHRSMLKNDQTVILNNYNYAAENQRIFIEVDNNYPLSVETKIKLSLNEKAVGNNLSFDVITIGNLIKLTEEEFEMIKFTNVDKKCISDLIEKHKLSFKKDRTMSTVNNDKIEISDEMKTLQTDVSDFFDILTSRRLKLAKIKTMEDFTNISADEFYSKFLIYPKQTYDAIVKNLIKLKVKFKKIDGNIRRNVDKEHLEINEGVNNDSKSEILNKKSEQISSVHSITVKFQTEIIYILENKENFITKKIYFPIYVQRKRIYVYKMLDELDTEDDKSKLLAYLLSVELITNNDIKGFNSNVYRNTLETYNSVLVNNDPIETLGLSLEIVEILQKNNIKYLNDLLYKKDIEIRLLKYQGLVITEENYSRIIDFLSTKKLKFKKGKYDGSLDLEYAVKFVIGLIEGCTGHILSEGNINLFMYLLDNAMSELSDLEKIAIITKNQLDGNLYTGLENNSAMSNNKLYDANSRAINKIIRSCYFIEIKNYFVVKTIEEKLVDIEFILNLVNEHK